MLEYKKMGMHAFLYEHIKNLATKVSRKMFIIKQNHISIWYSRPLANASTWDILAPWFIHRKGIRSPYICKLLATWDYSQECIYLNALQA